MVFHTKVTSDAWSQSGSESISRRRITLRPLPPLPVGPDSSTSRTPQVDLTGISSTHRSTLVSPLPQSISPQASLSCATLSSHDGFRQAPTGYTGHQTYATDPHGEGYLYASRDGQVGLSSVCVLPHSQRDLDRGSAQRIRMEGGTYDEEDHGFQMSTSQIVLAWSADLDLPPEPGERLPSGFSLSRKRLASLAEVDDAKLSWFHLKVAAIAGVGFFSDTYDIFSINVASTMLAYIYTDGRFLRFQDDPNEGHSGASKDSVIKAAAPIGTFIGQLLFGWLADRVGRKRMYGVELIIIIIATFGQTLTANDSLGTLNIIWTLSIWRFIMGCGVGGDYPLSAIISSEFSATHIRGRMMVGVFSNQGWGQICASVVGLLAIIGARNAIADIKIPAADPEVMVQLDRAWRILIGVGCVPAALALYFRLTIPETPRFTMDVERNVKQAVDDIERFLSTGSYKFDPDSVVVRVVAPRRSWADFKRYFAKWENLQLLLGCSISWFTIDITFYGLGLNTDRLFNAVGFAPFQTDGKTLAFATAEDVFKYFINLCEANMLLSVTGLIPGYWTSFFLIDHKRWGRRRIQLLGFGMLSVLFIVMAASFTTLISRSPGSMVESLFEVKRGAAAFLTLFCLVGFFENFGPNSTTFIVPGEVFPTRYRSTGYGISAASGKLGAIVSQFALTRIKRTESMLWAYVPFTITGIFSTLLLPETMHNTLEDNSNEDQEFFIQGLVQHPLSREQLITTVSVVMHSNRVTRLMIVLGHFVPGADPGALELKLSTAKLEARSLIAMRRARLECMRDAFPRGT